MTMGNQVVARVTHRFTAPAERVFDAWLDPELIRKWFGLNIGPTVRIEVDPRVGGTFSFVQRRDGQDIDHTGEYLEVNRPNRLVFTWFAAGETDESRLVIEIIPTDTCSQLTLSHVMSPKWADFVSHLEEVWGKMLAEMEVALDQPAAQ